MALARVQATARGNHGSASSFVFPSFPAAPTVGNALILFICNWTASPAIASITDNRGNTYVQADDITNSIGARIWYCSKIVGTGSPFTITATFASGSNYATSCAVEVSGVGTGLLIDQIAHATGGVGSGFTMSTGNTAALTGPENFLATLLGSRGTGVATVESVSPAWTEEFEDTSTATCPGEGDTRVKTGTAGTTASSSWTCGTQNSWAATIVAFRAPTVAPPSTDIILYQGDPTPTTIILREAGTLTTSTRVTQSVVEVLAGVAPWVSKARVTQSVVEILSQPSVAARSTQSVVEVLGALRPNEIRSTQAITEVLAGVSPLIAPLFENATITTGLTYMRLTTRSGQVYSWSDRPLPDPADYEGGWKAPRVLTWGRLRRALSGVDGQYETSDFVVTLDDTDRLLRELDKQEELINATVVVKKILDSDRRKQLPWTTLYRGVIRDARPMGVLQYELTIKDPYAEQFSATSTPMPRRQIFTADFPNCTVDTVASSAVGYRTTSSTSTAGSTSTAVTGGSGTFGVGDQIRFAGNSLAYAVTSSSGTDPETSITFSPGLSANVPGNAAITVETTRKVQPAIGMRVPFWYGHITDRFMFGGFDSGDGQGPVIYVGDRVLADGKTYGEWLWSGHACYSPGGKPFPMIYFWNYALDDLVYVVAGIGNLATEASTGGRLAIPGYSNWTSLGFTTPYVDRNGHRYTVLFMRGIFRDWALSIREPPPNIGGTPFAVDAYGIEDVGDGTGNLILNAFDQYYHLLINWCPPKGDGYQSGPWLTPPVFTDDPSVPMIDQSSFTKAQAQSAVYTNLIGESAGFRGDFGVGVNNEEISVRDLLARLNVSFGCDSGFSKNAQYFVTMVNWDPATLIYADPLGWERDIFTGTFNIDALTRDLFTTIEYRHTQDYIGRMEGGWRSVMTGQLTTTDGEALAAYGADTIYSTANLYMVRGENRAGDAVEYQRGTKTARVVVALKRSRLAWVQHIVTLQTGPAGFNYELGDVVPVTHYEGLSNVGWTDHPVRIERVEIDPSAYVVTLEGYDLDPMLGDDVKQTREWRLGRKLFVPEWWRSRG